jgi:hypothetical protein
MVRRSAPQAAKTAALNGNCAQAKAIVAAASSMGASNAGSALAGTKCQ